jgi:hypothetical protein
VDFVEPARAFALELVGGRGHYERVVRAAMEARRSVWIATANLKELMVEDHRAVPGRRRSMRSGGRGAGAYRSILDVFDDLAGRGVELRILHASPPSRAFRATLAKSARLKRALALRACPRVHFKIVIVDGAFVYLGSANWTGAGLGPRAKGGATSSWASRARTTASSIGRRRCSTTSGAARPAAAASCAISAPVRWICRRRPFGRNGPPGQIPGPDFGPDPAQVGGGARGHFEPARLAQTVAVLRIGRHGAAGK